MRTILLSFDYDVFQKLEVGEKRLEYRCHFPAGPVKAYFYVCRPVQAISGIAYFDERISMDKMISYYNNNPEALQRLSELSEGCDYAAPIKTFIPTNRISLSDLQKEFPDFLIPRMYYFLENRPLLEFLDQHITPVSEPIEFDTSQVPFLNCDLL